VVVAVIFSFPAFNHAKRVLEGKFSLLEPSKITENHRFDFYRIGAKMFFHEPLLGFGSGGFSRNFFRYYKVEKFESYYAAYASAHSVYLKMFTERGILGLLAYLLLILSVLYFGFKQSQNEGKIKKLFLISLSISLIGEMIIYGFVFDPFYLRVFELIFWIFLAFMVSTSKPIIPKIPFTKKKAVTLGIIFFVLLGYRLWRVKAEPISDHYEAGFYRWEMPRKGKDRQPYRLTSPRALKVLKIKGEELRFRVCSNKPDVAQNHQVLYVYLNGKLVKQVVLKNKKWQQVVIPTATLRGKKVFMDFRVAGAWVPYKYGRGKSRKELGVIISKIQQN